MLNASRVILAIALLVNFILVVRPEADSQSSLNPTDAESKAVHYLNREVPAWHKENSCYSCHNNGDGARALFLASSAGHRLPSNSLADTNVWLAHPAVWDENRGDPGFSDKTLADVQFAASLSDAVHSGSLIDRNALEQAARRLLQSQAADGSWRIEPANVLGSPATWGTPLATFMTLRTLRRSQLAEAESAIARAGMWLAKLRPLSTLEAATILLAVGEGVPITTNTGNESLKLIVSSQTSDGGWGPYPGSPPEPFDTALALLALASAKNASLHGRQIAQARRFLASEQENDGSWAATTRPRGGESYAQKISTTAWVTIALLASR